MEAWHSPVTEAELAYAARNLRRNFSRMQSQAIGGIPTRARICLTFAEKLY